MSWRGPSLARILSLVMQICLISLLCLSELHEQTTRIKNNQPTVASEPSEQANKSYLREYFGSESDDYEQASQDELNDGFELTEDWARRVCSRNRGAERRQMLANTFLRFCWRHRLINLLSSNSDMWIMHNSSSECQQILNDFIKLDEKIHYFDDLFTKLLDRYNCHNGYSVKWTCNDCRRAYTDWLCTTNLPFFMNGERVKPCISYCERVEQRCPYFHPVVREQYGGQPLFICEDPRIQEMPELAENAIYGSKNHCYDLCHLKAQAETIAPNNHIDKDNDDLKNDITNHDRSDFDADIARDTLSKYDPRACPPATLIASQILNSKMEKRKKHAHLACENSTSQGQSTKLPAKGFTCSFATPKNNDNLQREIFQELETVVKTFKVQKSKAGNFVHNHPK